MGASQSASALSSECKKSKSSRDNHNNNNENEIPTINTATTSTSISMSMSTSMSKNEHYFPQFYLLSDEIALEILSYVSHAPFEPPIIGPIEEFGHHNVNGNGTTNGTTNGTHNDQSQLQQQQPIPTSTPTLTNIFPLVSKQFNKLSQNDTLWIPSFQRLIYNNNYPNQWKHALSNLLKHGSSSSNNNDDLLLLPLPTWSAFHNPNVDRDDFMLYSKVQSMDTLLTTSNTINTTTKTSDDDREEFNNLILNIFHSIQKRMKDEHHDRMKEQLMKRMNQQQRQYQYENEHEHEHEHEYIDTNTTHIQNHNEYDNEYENDNNNNNDSGTIINNIDTNTHTNTDSHTVKTIETSKMNAKNFYKMFIMNYLTTTLPIFHLPGIDRGVGMYMDLVFYEPRYKALIHEIMDNAMKQYTEIMDDKTNDKNSNSSTRSNTRSARSKRKRVKQQSKATYKAYWEGQRIPHPRPKFIFVSEHHLQQDRRTYGYIVTVCKCKVLDDGSVPTRIKFMEQVELFHVEERLQRQQHQRERQQQQQVNVVPGLHDAHIKRFH